MEPITSNNNLNTNNSFGPSPIGQPKKPFNAKLVAMIIGAALLAGAGVFAAMYPWGAGKTDNVNVVISLMPTQTPTPSTSQTADETARWQTYRNEKYGFTVKYSPEIWSLDNVGFYAKEKIGQGPEPLVYNIFLSEYKNSQRLSFKDIVTKNLDPITKNNFKFTKETVGAYSVYKTSSLPSRLGTLDVCFTEDETKYVCLGLSPADNTFESYNKYKDIFDKMISTFKFTPLEN